MDLLEARKLAKSVKKLNDKDNFVQKSFKHGRENIHSSDLPFVADCCAINTEKFRKKVNDLVESLPNDLAKKLDEVALYIHLEEVEHLLKAEAPTLYELYQEGLSTAALYTIISFLSGKEVTINVRKNA